MKKIIIVFFVIATCVSLKAQDKSSISDIFSSMPDDFLAAVDLAQKEELLLHPDSTRLTIKTDIDENVTRTALADDYIALETSSIGSLQIKLLPLVNNTNVVGVITTVCGPACSSQIDFYTTSWEPLDGKDLFPTINRNWFISPDISSNENVINNIDAILDMTPIKLNFVPNKSDITAEYDIEKYLSADDYKTIKPFLIKDPVVLRWDKQSYKR